MERVPGLDEPRPRSERPESAIARGKEHERIPAGAGERDDVPPQPGPTRAGLDTEDDLHDDVEGDRLHARAQRERLAHRPASDLRPRDVADGGLPGAPAVTLGTG